MTVFPEGALSLPLAPQVGDPLADASDTVSVLVATTPAGASGNKASGKSAYSIIFALVFGGVSWLELGVHARGPEAIKGDAFESWSLLNSAAMWFTRAVLPSNIAHVVSCRRKFSSASTAAWWRLNNGSWRRNSDEAPQTHSSWPCKDVLLPRLASGRHLSTMHRAAARPRFAWSITLFSRCNIWAGAASRSMRWSLRREIKSWRSLWQVCTSSRQMRISFGTRPVSVTVLKADCKDAKALISKSVVDSAS